MTRYLIKVLCLLIVLMINAPLSFAEQKNNFSVIQANDIFDQISLKLATQNLVYTEFKEAIVILSDLNEKAKFCYESNLVKLEKVESQLERFNQPGNIDSNRKDYVYLIEKKNNLNQQASECHLFEIRSSEAIIQYVNTLHSLTASRLISKEASLWQIFNHSQDLIASFKSIEIQSLLATIKNYWYIFILMLMTYLIYWQVIKWILYKSIKDKSVDSLNHLECFKKLLYHRANILGIIGLVGFLVYYLLILSQSPIILSNFSFQVFMSLGSLGLLWCLFLIKSLIKSYKLYKLTISCFSLMTLLMVLVTINGYHNLSIYLILNVFLSMFCLFLLIYINRLIIFMISKLDKNDSVWVQKFKYYLGVAPYKAIPEVMILKVISSILVVLLYITLLVYIWGRGTAYPAQYVSAIFDGFSFFQVSIELPNIILALLIFVLLCFTGRYLSARISRKHQKEDKDLQVALASIIGYISFSLAILITLLISGVNFTGLAIIAGALSVGIGLGLQDIVNNFVSGVILLLEKPIKPGDRIIIGETEGFVKKVRVRSTHITTLTKSDVIVPNADLIKNQVTNYMYKDRYWRIACPVGVAYGSDTDLVKKVLLEVAHNHKSVITKEPDGPMVLFREFGDSSLNFELWCIIHDVNNKFIIQSELNFEIDKAFRKNKITIAFPQRDVHLFQKSN